MIFKEKDPIDDQIRSLEHAAQTAPTATERNRVEKELAFARAGLKGEQEAAYYIDFHLKDGKNWAVIHDLRIECNCRVAQIDHLLIDRFLEIYVVESKSFRTKIRHANGGWERWGYRDWEGIPCPVEQNQRHIFVLDELIKHKKLAPTRLGMAMPLKFFNVVVVHPACSIVGKMPRDARIYRMDKLVSKIRAADATPLDLWKVISPGTLHAFAAELAEQHTPAPKPNGAALELNDRPVAKAPEQPCQECRGALTVAEADYCQKYAARFGGKLLCRRCQAHFRSSGKPPAAATPRNTAAETAARCAECGAGVDRKVIAFCRFSSKRFGGRVLCRQCQSSVSVTS